MISIGTSDAGTVSNDQEQSKTGFTNVGQTFLLRQLTASLKFRFPASWISMRSSPLSFPTVKSITLTLLTQLLQGIGLISNNLALLSLKNN